MKHHSFLSLFFLCLLTQAKTQSKNNHPVYYAEVHEEIRANYTNLLQQTDSSSFRKTVNEWNAIIYFGGTNGDQNFLRILPQKTSFENNIPAALTDSAGILSPLSVRFRLSQKIAEVC